MEVVDAEFECRDWYRSTSGSTSWFGNLERFLSRKITFRLFPVSIESESCFSFILSVSGDQQIRKSMIENKLVRENIEGNCEEHKKIKGSKKNIISTSPISWQKPCDWEETKDSHGWASSQTGFYGREHPEEPQGCCVMGKNEFSHNCDTPGTRIGQGYHPIKPGCCSQKGWTMGSQWAYPTHLEGFYPSLAKGEGRN